MSVLDSALSTTWAMLPDETQNLLTIADRAHTVTPELLEAYRARSAEQGERLRIRDNVAILDVRGPLFKRANLFTEVSGATSYEVLRRDLQVALDDPEVHGIVLSVDSPGGQASGCDELSAAIYGARGKKPIVSYVSGMAASGGYWIASAADKIVVSDLALLGSIGVVLAAEDRSKQDETRGIKRFEFVSSASPGKRPDLNTDSGRALLQKRVDDLGAVFIAAVAKHRGVTEETVSRDFGAGGVEVGANAVALGMADEVGSFEGVLASLSPGGGSRRINRSTGVPSMSDNQSGGNTATVDVDKAVKEAAAQAQKEERARIAAINGSDEAKAFPKLAAAFVEDGTDSQTATKYLAAAQADAEASGRNSTQNSQADDYETRKENAGALGFEASEPDKDAAVADGWKKAVDNANQRFGNAV